VTLKCKDVDRKVINVAGINILLMRKNIKNINFSVSAPGSALDNEFNTQVRISAPKEISEDELLVIITSKVNWIRKKLQRIQESPALTKKEYSSGECHYIFGKAYILEVIEQTREAQNIQLNSDTLKMFIRPNTTIAKRETLLNEYYRTELKKRIPELIKKWQPIVRKEVSEWGVKRMKTRWGTCNINKKRIWLNLELAKWPEACLEYVVVHEMTHLLERNHTHRFKKLLDGFVPNWPKIESMLNTHHKKGALLEFQ